MPHGLARIPTIPGATMLALVTPIATAAAANGISSKRPPLDRSNQTHMGFTTCTATSGSWLRIAGTRTTTAHQWTDQHGFRAAIQATASSVVAPGATKANSSARPFATGAISTSSSTLSGSG